MHKIGRFGHTAQNGVCVFFFFFFLKIQYTEKTLVFPILNHKLKTQE